MCTPLTAALAALGGWYKDAVHLMGCVVFPLHSSEWGPMGYPSLLCGEDIQLLSFVAYSVDDAPAEE